MCSCSCRDSGTVLRYRGSLQTFKTSPEIDFNVRYIVFNRTGRSLAIAGDTGLVVIDLVPHLSAPSNSSESVTVCRYCSLITLFYFLLTCHSLVTLFLLVFVVRSFHGFSSCPLSKYCARSRLVHWLYDGKKEAFMRAVTESPVISLMILIWPLYVTGLARWEAGSFSARRLGMHCAFYKLNGILTVTLIWVFSQQMVFSGWLFCYCPTFLNSSYVD